MSKVAQRILDVIAKDSGVTSVGLIASDLRYQVETVKRHVAKLMASGQVVHGWDGQSLELSDEARRDRQLQAPDAIVLDARRSAARGTP